MSTPSIRRDLADLAPVAVLLFIGGLGFATVFTGSGYLIAVTAGTLAGLGVVMLSRVARISALPSVAIFALVLLLVGAVATRQGLTEFCVAVVKSWKQLLTVNPPVHAEAGLLTVPYITAIISAFIAGSLALRLRWPSPQGARAIALIPAIAPLLTAIAFGTRNTWYPVVLGGGFLVVSVGWLSAHRASQVARTGANGMRLALAGVILVGSAACGAAVAPQLTGDDRALLRDHIVPPVHTNEYVTPLASFRHYLKDFRSTTLMKVTGMAPGTRLRIAAMDRFDGQVYNVAAASSRDSDSGVFGRLAQADSSASHDALGFAVGNPVLIRIEDVEYEGVWIPSPGPVVSVQFESPRATDIENGLFYNPASWTAMSTAGLGRGDVVILTADSPKVVSDSDLASTGFAALTVPTPESVPPEVATVANKAVGTATTPIQRARALEAYLHREGFYSDGLQGQVRSRAGHNSDRISVLLSGDQMIGNDEQYAVAMALMAQSMGMPARVVTGFQMPAGRDNITGDDVRAWVEIAFKGVGWVPFDPTPPRDKLPQQQAPKPKTSSDPLVAEPPQPPQDRVQLGVTTNPDDGTNDNSWLWLLVGLLNVVIVLAQAIGLLLLLALPFVVIVALKWRRRRDRRALTDASARVAAGWQEFADTAIDLGVALPASLTRLEMATATSTRYSSTDLTALATGADATVFSPGPATDEDADRYWGHIDERLAEIRAGVKPSVWWRGVLNFRSLLSGLNPVREIRSKLSLPTIGTVRASSRKWVR
ncbi:transglutaminaseTgpA domain-containing protein [Smaragdicoccus niigatensis]|uniref:transglutaminase family protein n=1 Tax=Smaragdicoccus niigatensis TaxID=359359 RepID=UPI00035FD966|nr:transglutaminase domain-containing protein [Smaragdicoccus niigatensis]